MERVRTRASRVSGDGASVGIGRLLPSVRIAAASAGGDGALPSLLPARASAGVDRAPIQQLPSAAPALPEIAPALKKGYRLTPHCAELVEADLKSHHGSFDCRRLSVLQATESFDRLRASVNGRVCTLVTECSRADAIVKIQAKYDALRLKARPVTLNAEGQKVWTLDSSTERGKHVAACKVLHDNNVKIAAAVQTTLATRRAALVSSNAQLLQGSVLSSVLASDQGNNASRFEIDPESLRATLSCVQVALEASSTEISGAREFEDRTILIEQAVNLEEALEGLSRMLRTASDGSNFSSQAQLHGGTRAHHVGTGPGSRKSEKPVDLTRKFVRSQTSVQKFVVGANAQSGFAGDTTSSRIYTGSPTSAEFQSITQTGAAYLSSIAAHRSAQVGNTDVQLGAGAFAVLICPANITDQHKPILRVATAGSCSHLPPRLLTHIRAECLSADEIAHDHGLASRNTMQPKPLIRTVHPIAVKGKEVELTRLPDTPMRDATASSSRVQGRTHSSSGESESGSCMSYVE